MSTPPSPPAPPFDLGALLTSDLILPELRAADRWQAIDELIGHLGALGRIKPENVAGITAAVRKRESTMSTGIGLGIGMPHASTELVGELTGILGRSVGGVQFESLDGQPVNLVLLLLVPQGQLQRHLHTVASIARLLRQAELREALKSAPDAETLLATLRRYSSLPTA